MAYTAKVAVLKNTIVWQWFVIGVALFWAISATIGWKSMPDQLKINIGPQLPNSQLVMGINDAEDTAIWQFAQFFLSVINTWPENGEEDYLFRLKALRQMGVISQNFYKQFHGDYLDRVGKSGGTNSIRGIQRLDYTPLKYGFNSLFVSPVMRNQKPVEGEWIVDVVMQVNETLNNKTVRNPLLSYKVKVVRTFENIQGNDWGLQLDLILEKPTRLAQ